MTPAIEVRDLVKRFDAVEAVRHISFSGQRARERGQEVMYVTERAVFRLRPDGIELSEVAEGADVQRDVVQRMRFAPIVRRVDRMLHKRSR